MKKIEEGGDSMAGRKPKPTDVKKLEGNPGKRKIQIVNGRIPHIFAFFLQEYGVFLYGGILRYRKGGIVYE